MYIDMPLGISIRMFTFGFHLNFVSGDQRGDVTCHVVSCCFSKLLMTQPNVEWIFTVTVPPRKDPS